MNKSLFRFELEKSPLHTTVYGGTGRGKTYFVRRYLKLYQDQEHDQRSIIKLCKDERDWINPETRIPYDEFILCDIKEITSKNIDNFENCVIVLDDMGNKTKNFHGTNSELNNCYYNCTDGMAPELRYGMIEYNVKEDTFIIIDRNRSMMYDSRFVFLDLKALSLKDIFETDEINKLIAYIKPLMNSATDRITVHTDNYQFDFNKLLISEGIKIQNDVLTKKKFVANCLKYGGSKIGFVGFLLWIYNILKPDPTVRAAAQVTTQAGHLINRTNTLASFA